MIDSDHPGNKSLSFTQPLRFSLIKNAGIDGLGEPVNAVIAAQLARAYCLVEFLLHLFE